MRTVRKIFAKFHNQLIKQFVEIDWKLFFKNVYQKAKEVDITINAMSLVYTTLLSIIPLLIFSFYIMTLFNFFGGMDRIIAGMKEFILTHLATGTGETLIELLEGYIGQIDVAQLGIVSFISLLLVIVYMLTRIEKTFNSIWGVSEHRDYFKRFVAFWTFITLGTLLITISLSLTITVFTSYLSDSIINTKFSDAFLFRMISTLSYFLLYIIAYYLIPNTNVDPLAAIVGGTVSGVLFTLARSGYTMYTRNVVTYYRIHRIYGSLSVVPLFLIWLYMVWVITLFGAIISYVFHYRDSLNYIRSASDIKESVQDLVPVAILIILYKDFIDQKSEGASFKEISKRINLPIEVIKNNLTRMKRKKLIVETDNGKYIPLTKVEELSIWEICEQVIFVDEVEISNIFKDEEMYLILAAFKSGLKENLAQMTIKDLLDKEDK